MMHQAVLPPETTRNLKEVLELQLDILCWAAVQNIITQNSCENWLHTQTGDHDRARDISRWIWNSENRYEPLEIFPQKGTISQRGTWAQKIKTDALKFMNNPRGAMVVVDKKNDWEKAGSEFLIMFYEEFRYRGGLPPHLFSNNPGQNYTSQDFLSAFLIHNNQNLCVCPACDECSFHTISRDKVRTDIDHYLPKSKYPYLSIHPYNLVPLCHLCNAPTKKERDPLKKHGGYRNLEDVWLPYRGEQGLSKTSYLKVIIDDLPGKKVKIKEIKSKKHANVDEKIKVLKTVFDLPERWNKRADNIGVKLFNRIFHFSYNLPVDSSKKQILDNLDELLFLMTEDIGREPDEYAMIWLLARIIKEEEQLNIPNTPLREMIVKWLKTREIEADKIREKAREMRKVL